jgi:predicted lipoprotein
MFSKQPLFLFLLIITGISLFSFISCIEEDDNSADIDFNRGKMLDEIGNNVIIPSYQLYYTEVKDMDSVIALFATSPDMTDLSNLRIEFKEAYIAWQYVSTYEFGPAEEILLRSNTNTFPADTVQIRSNISSGNYDLASAGNMDAKGFPAMDYLLYGIADDSVKIFDQYVSDSLAANRLNYLKDISTELKENAEYVLTNWIESGGDYIHTFINNTGTDAGSSVGLLVNQLNYDFEIIKNYEIAIPLGKKTLGSPLPEKVQAYYAENSMQLTLEHFNAIENLYLGEDLWGNDGWGFDEYLIYLQSEYNGGMLSDAIKSQLTTASQALENVPDPLSQTILTNSSIVDDAYTELQKQLVLFKTDMPSALGVLITYQDNDGD